MVDQPAQEGQVRDQARDLGLGERRGEPVERLVARRAVGDQLRDQRVVARPDLVTLLDACVDADAGRQPQPSDPAGLRQKRPRVLRVEPHFDRGARELRFGRVEPLALGDPDLLSDEVDAGDELGDRVLDLDPPVQLEEPEVAAVEHELSGACALVSDCAGEGHRRLAHLPAQLRVERRRWRFLEHFLVTALHRALTLAKRDDVPVRVAEQLDLDVPGPLDEALEEHAVVAEGCPGLALRGRERLLELARRPDDPHPAPAAARRRLDHEGEPDLVRTALAHDRHARRPRDPLRLELIAAARERLRRGPDPQEPGRVDRSRELGAFGEEPVAGMDRVRAGLLGRPDALVG